MATETAAIIPALREHLALTQVKLYTPEAPEYDDIESCFLVSPNKTSAIARPQTAEDVATLIRFCVANSVKFAVRSGGHDTTARTKVQGALFIDMRDINYVSISVDKTTARVGGGILTSKLAKSLNEQGLVTPCGTVSSVGYVGWSTLGGYGPFSTCYGLGVDQIVAAKVVNAEGQIVDADNDMLTGIRGGGGTLGVITELTIKVYPLEKILLSTIVYDSANMESAMSSYIEYYDKLVAAEELPTALQLQTLTVELPNLGVVFAVLAVWTDPDEEEGRQWIKKIASAAPCIMDSAESVTIPDFLANNEKLVTWPSYGRAYTASVKRLTPKTMKVLAKYSQVAPGGSLAISVHSLRSPKPNEASVFGSRTDHHVLEIIAMVTDPALQAEREAWAMRLKEELIAQDPDNILEGSYISLGSDADTDLKKVYGPHYNRLMELKTKYDAGNVFKYAVPRLFQIGPEDSA